MTSRSEVPPIRIDVLECHKTLVELYDKRTRFQKFIDWIAMVHVQKRYVMYFRFVLADNSQVSQFDLIVFHNIYWSVVYVGNHNSVSVMTLAPITDPPVDLDPFIGMAELHKIKNHVQQDLQG